MPSGVSSANSIITLIVFFVTNFILIFPFRIPLPVPILWLSELNATLIRCRITQEPRDQLSSVLVGNSSRKTSRFRLLHVPVNLHTAPLFSVLLLLAIGAIDGSTIRDGVLGTDGIQPLDIMALFISLAYLSISLDAAGLFRFLAFWVAKKGGSSGRKLYFYLYAFFFIASIFVGNDPIILSGTAFLAYFTRIAGISPPTAWIQAEFTVANMGSAILPPSNPTNLVLTGAFGIPFLTYTAHTILPVLATAAFVYPILTLVLFRSREFVPQEIDMEGLTDPPETTNEVDSPASRETTAQASTPNSQLNPGALTDKNGTMIGSILLGATLILLIATSTLRVPVWQVTVPSALLMMGRDIWHDRHFWLKAFGRRMKDKTSKLSLAANRTSQRHDSPIEISVYEESITQDDGQVDVIPLRLRSQPSVLLHSRVSIPTENDVPELRTLSTCIHHFQHDLFPTIGTIVPRLPYPLIPFALCMFILVQGLVSKGWVDIFAKWWTSWINVCSTSSSGHGVQLLGAAVGMLFISTILCNACGTNIGTTILLTRIIQTWISNASDSSPIPPQTRLGTIYALALGSNFGAFSLSFSASLAGLLWRGILLQKGIHVRQKTFACYNLPVVGVAICVAGGILVAELIVVER